ncbi:hypothetical protein EJB05_09090, partial [Eragrostis curvula]
MCTPRDESTVICGDRARSEDLFRPMAAEATLRRLASYGKMLHGEGELQYMYACGLDIVVPPSDIGEHLGSLLDSADGSDISFAIGSERFHTHHYVLATCSSIFKAQLLSSMADASMSCITLIARHHRAHNFSN